MFGINPTPFDVRLVAFRIPIRVHPSFWLAGIMLGGNQPASLLFIWVVCTFVSVLVHELGHALTAEAFDWPTEIVLYFGGGLAISHRFRNNTPWRSIAVSIMGPMAGFMLLALVIGISVILAKSPLWDNIYVYSAFEAPIFLNKFYGLFNLLPVLPLDGGHILLSLCQVIGLRDPLRVTLVIGIIVSAIVAYISFAILHQPYMGAMLLLSCIQNVSALRSRR